MEKMEVKTSIFFSLLPFFTDLSAGLAKASYEGKYIYILYNLLYM